MTDKGIVILDYSAMGKVKGYGQARQPEDRVDQEGIALRSIPSFMKGDGDPFLSRFSFFWCC